MLYSAVLEMESLEACAVGSGSGYQAYGLLLRLISSRWPGTSARLHRDEGAKPFTLSPVRAKGPRGREGLRLEAGAPAYIRVTCLDAEVMERLIDVVVSWPDSQTVSVGPAGFRLKGLRTTPGAMPGCRVTTFPELYESAGSPGSVTLRFASPTTFRSKGSRNVVFPSPRLVFNSLLARWNQYAPPDLRLALPDDLDSYVSPQGYRLGTRMMDFGTYQEQGFQGTCRYRADSGDDDLPRALAALAAFAFYAGVGAKTTMGMGQCWRARPRPPSTDEAAVGGGASRSASYGASDRDGPAPGSRP